jgi:hypothetical protein
MAKHVNGDKKRKWRILNFTYATNQTLDCQAAERPATAEFQMTACLNPSLVMLQQPSAKSFDFHRFVPTLRIQDMKRINTSDIEK